MKSHHQEFSRRRLFRAAAFAAAGSIPFLGAGAAYAVVPDSPRFKLAGMGDDPIIGKQLRANWVMQSFAYDHVGQHVYFAQHNTEDSDPDHVGDLWITKTDTAGNQLGSMALHGFGHGVQIGVEPFGGSVYLWTEWQASGGGFGTKVGRFAFVNGAVLERDDGSIEDRTIALDNLHPVSPNPQPAIDPQYNRLAVRFRDADSTMRIVLYDLADARAGRLTTGYRKVERALPVRTKAWAAANPFQGFTVFGRYAYLLEGGVSDTSYITVIDLNASGQSVVQDRWPTQAGKSLPGREPQGMAVWLAPVSGGVQPRLCFGFHSNTGGVRQANVFYKSEFE
ncbi:hypothetical protein AB0F17_48685 [Nonomuraea sp. NPDC026600]|uniref:phage baseplate protein n=1 Tax=Nonomuraea sp. NPDC026600 TaxID=3155363 RepID=UPI0033FD6030